MIQAPQLQYVPQHPVQTGYQQTGAYTPIQSQNTLPGAIYNYPMASSYVPAQTTGQSKFNGVNIEILNPQGQGNCAAPQQNAAPVLYPGQANGQYNGVNIEILNPQGQGCSSIPAQNIMPAQFYPIQQPQLALPPAPVYQTLPPAPQVQPQAALPAQNTQPVVPEPQIQTTPNATAPVIAQPTTSFSEIRPETFAGKLKTDDLDAQKNAIEEIAEKVKNSETDGPVLLDTQIFDALVDIIDRDTSSLAGPSPEVMELRLKNPEELNDEDRNKVGPTPLEKAEINKQYALYTISYMQERLNGELEKRNGKALELKDLPCIETVVDTAKSNPNPMLRIGAIAGLSHIARPEYNEDLKTIFDLAQYDEDDRVRDAAITASENLAK